MKSETVTTMDARTAMTAMDAKTIEIEIEIAEAETTSKDTANETDMTFARKFKRRNGARLKSREETV